MIIKVAYVLIWAVAVVSSPNCSHTVLLVSSVIALLIIVMLHREQYSDSPTTKEKEIIIYFFSLFERTFLRGVFFRSCVVS